VASEVEHWPGLQPGERPYRQAAWYYAEYRYRPEEDFFRLLAAHLGWTRSDRILDLGAGPGHVSLRIAPLVEEVVALEPEQTMLEEGERRARAAEAGNISFVLGGSDDLERLSPTLGTFTGVVISQAFHWMRDQDRVLRDLDELVDPERGAVALIGFVNDPDYNRIWIDREPWSRVGAILSEHLAHSSTGPDPGGRHDPFPEILSRSSFSKVELLTYEHEIRVEPSIDAAIGIHYSLANVLDRLGDERVAFEAAVATALAGADGSPLTIRVVDSALIGRRRQAADA
jgi:SAM-dependent methyltransferase